MLSNPRSTGKEITCSQTPEVPSKKSRTYCHFPNVPSKKLHVVTSQKYRQSNYMLSRPRSTVKLHAVASHKYRQSNYMLSNPISTVKEITYGHFPEISSKKLHAVTPQKYRQTNYMFHIPEVSNIHIYLWFDIKYFQILFQIMFPFRTYFEKRILYPSRL